MIRLFVSDIDGCLSEPFRPFDRERLDAIARLAARGDPWGVPGAPPAFSLCTGRPYAYTEAMTQALGLTMPVLFEAGAGLFEPVKARTTWHPEFDEALERDLEELRSWLASVVRGTGLFVDIGKRTQASVIGPARDDVRGMLPLVRARVAERHPDLTVASTPVSIDILSRRLTKARGLAWLADELRIPLAETAFIGDTDGDIGGLRAVGRSFAPANASDEVRSVVDVVTTGRVAEGVHEAYLACIRTNQDP
jgi:hypothetical protein